LNIESSIALLIQFDSCLLFHSSNCRFFIRNKNILKATCRLELLLDFEAKCSKPTIDDLRSLWQRDSTLNKMGEGGVQATLFTFIFQCDYALDCRLELLLDLEAKILKASDDRSPALMS